MAVASSSCSSVNPVWRARAGGSGKGLLCSACSNGGDSEAVNIGSIESTLLIVLGEEGMPTPPTLWGTELTESPMAGCEAGRESKAGSMVRRTSSVGLSRRGVTVDRLGCHVRGVRRQTKKTRSHEQDRQTQRQTQTERGFFATITAPKSRRRAEYPQSGGLHCRKSQGASYGKLEENVD